MYIEQGQDCTNTNENNKDIKTANKNKQETIQGRDKVGTALERSPEIKSRGELKPVYQRAGGNIAIKGAPLGSGYAVDTMIVWRFWTLAI